MPGTTYSAADIVDKTLIAAKPVLLYDYPDASYPPVGTVQPGGTVGIVYSWVMEGAQLWWMLWPAASGGNYLYTPHIEGNFDLQALADQGVLTEQQKQEQQKPWYERLLITYGPWVLAAGIAAAALKGYLSRPRSKPTQP